MPVVLYERQRQILDFVSQYIQRNGFAPSLREIADAMGLRSLATIHEHLDQLQKRGVISITGRGKKRLIEIIDKHMAEVDKGVKLPILGLFSQGKQIEPYSVGHAFVGVAPSMISSRRRAIVLEVKDDSLVQEGIFKDDFLILEEEAELDNGDVVVALLEKKEALLKKFYQETTRVKLESLHGAQAPHYVQKIQIQGKVVGLIRRY